MKEILQDFAEWLPDNLEDIFELIDNPEEVIDRYLKTIELYESN